MILYCFISYPWYFCFNSRRSCPYFVLFSSSFFSRSVSQRSCQISKKSIFGAALCRVMYLFCARAVQPARTWATLSGALLHTLHVTSPFISVCVFCQSHNLVGIIIIIIIIIINVCNVINCFLHSPRTGANRWS